MLKVQFELAGSSECSDVIVLGFFCLRRLAAARSGGWAFINVVGTAVLCTPSDWGQRVDTIGARPRAPIQNSAIIT